MSHYKRSGQMDMTDRVAIETGLCKGESFKEIAKRIERHPSTVSHEVQENRTHIASTYYAGKDCAKVRQCVLTGLCGASKSALPWQMKSIRIKLFLLLELQYNAVLCLYFAMVPEIHFLSKIPGETAEPGL